MAGLINNTEETKYSIRLFIFLTLLSFLINLCGLFYVYKYFSKRQRNSSSINIFKLFSFLPFIVWLFGSFAFMISMELETLVDKRYSIITNNCHILSTLGLSVYSITDLSLNLFILSRIKYFFKSTSSKISLTDFLMHAAICTSLTIFTGMSLFFVSEPTIFIANDHENYKLCHFTANSILIVIVMGISSIYSIYLLHLYYKQYEHQQKSDNNLINRKIMIRVFFMIIIYKSIQFLSILLFVTYAIKYVFSFLGIINCILVLSSLDIMNNNNDENNDNDKKKSDEDRKKQESDKYIEEIMKLYYAKPKRRKTNTTINHTMVDIKDES